jgi:PAS domain S-box-containing protein
MPTEGRPEKALTSSEQELRLLVEAIPALVWRAGPEGNIEYVNKRVLDYLGAPLDEVIGWGWMDKVHPDDVAFKVRTWLQNLESGDPHSAACRFRGADGRYRWFAVRAEPVRASDRGVLGWCGVLIDIDDRKKAQEAVRESEYELRQIIDTVPGLIWSTSPDGEPTHVSQRLLDYGGMRFEDFKHRGWEALVHPDDFPQTAKAYDHAIQSGTSYHGVVRLRRADGEFRWHHARCEPLRDRRGRIIQWYGLSVEIDEAQLQAILNVIPAYTWYAAPSGALTFVNKRTADYLGLPKDHPLRFGIDIGAQWDDWVQLLHPDDREDSLKVWSTCLRTGEAGQYSFRVRNAEGGYRWFLSRSDPLRASDGTLLQWVGVNFDIEEVKRAEQALRESEYKLRQIIETVPSLLWSLGPHGEQTQLNQRALDYIGVGYEDLLSLGWTAFLHPDDLPETASAFAHSMQTGTSFQAVHRLRRADGEYFWHHARGEPLRDGQGGVIQWYGLTVDIDERKRAEDRLRRSEAYLAEAQRLSHTGSFGWTPSTGELHWSDETFRILEYEPSIQPTIERVLQRIHPDDLAMMRRVLDETSRGEKDFDITHRLLMPGGSVKFVHVLSNALKDAAGNLEIVGALMDVTENTLLYRDLAEREARLMERTAALRRSEAYLSEAQSLGHTGSSAYNETAILYWSDENYRIFGFDPREGLPSHKAALERIHPDDRERVREEARQAVEQKKDYKLEYRMLLPDGAIKYIETDAHPKFSTSGELIEVVSTIIDVTERKRAEEALRESEQRFRDYAETASDWYWETDAEHKFARITDYERLLARGFVPLSRIGLARWEYATDVESEPEKWELHRSTLEARQPFRDFVYRAARTDGSPVYYKISGKPLYDAKGAFLGYRGTGADVTATMRAESALQESQAKFRDYAQSASDWFWEIGPDYKFTLLTENAFGSNAADRIGTACWDRALDLETEPEKWRLLWATLESRKPFRDFVYCSTGGNGCPMYVKATGKPVFDANGEFRGYRGTGADVTATVRAQEEHERLRQLESDLAHLNRLSMMGELAASLAHEITQPIAAARNNARAALNFLDRQPAELGEVREALGCVVGDADRAGVIIDRIRDHVRKAPPRKHRFDLNEAINEVIVLARSAIAENRVSVRTRLAEGLAPVEGDRVQLQQVILNLILNAAEAMSAVDEGARELSISTEQSRKNDLLVAVRDSGPGIDPEHIERVFDAFYTTKSSGVGMGLSICRSIIDAHGGRLWADANEPRGAAFQFSLPSPERSS